MSSQLNGYLRNDIFRTRSSSNELFLAPERPNHQLVLRLRLRTPIGTIFTNLDVALNKDGMRIDEIITDQYNNNVIIVRGTPPVNGYNENSVLEIVRQHDNGAEIV